MEYRAFYKLRTLDDTEHGGILTVDASGADAAREKAADALEEMEREDSEILEALIMDVVPAEVTAVTP